MAISADLHHQLRQLAQAVMPADPAHDLAHLDRVWTNARQIAGDGTDRRVLMAASYLHDLVNLPKDDPNRAQDSVLSAEKSAPLLSDLGYCTDEITATQHAIAAHSFSAGIPPETPEARILRDADRLDALGAIGIARTFAVAGALGRALYDPADPFARNRPLNDLAFSIDHWRVKLLALPGDMLTEQGRALAQKRARYMIGFLDIFAGEIGETLPGEWRET